MEKTVTYYRVFTKKERQLQSLEEQKKLCKEYISNHKKFEFIEIPNNKEKQGGEKNEESGSIL